jgi:hypothetical protein
MNINTASDPQERVCVDCSFTFRIDAQWWIDRQLALPKRCPACRAIRRANAQSMEQA